MNKYDALEELATKADQGTWKWVGMSIESDDQTVMDVGDDGEPWGMHSTAMNISPENEAWIVAGNPSVVLGLIADVKALAKALEPFALMSAEGVIAEELGHVSVTTCAEYFHRARAALSRIQEPK